MLPISSITSRCCCFSLSSLQRMPAKSGASTDFVAHVDVERDIYLLRLSLGASCATFFQFHARSQFLGTSPLPHLHRSRPHVRNHELDLIAQTPLIRSIT